MTNGWGDKYVWLDLSITQWIYVETLHGTPSPSTILTFMFSVKNKVLVSGNITQWSKACLTEVKPQVQSVPRSISTVFSLFLFFFLFFQYYKYNNSNTINFQIFWFLFSKYYGYEWKGPIFQAMDAIVLSGEVL